MQDDDPGRLDEQERILSEHNERFGVDLELGANGADHTLKTIAPKSRFFPASDLDDLEVPPRTWLVENLIPSGTVTLLGGDGGTGKSLLALQLAAAVATGSRWIGHTCTQGGAIYLTAEDDIDELHRRISTICGEAGQSLADLDRLTLRSMAGEDALLAYMHPQSVLTHTPLFDELDTYLESLPPCLLVLDTLADLFPGNENDRAQARQFIGMLRGLAINHDCAVLLLAHPSLTGLNTGTGTSGSTGWNNSVRSRLYLERVKDDDYETNPDARILSTKKSNYGRTGGETQLTWKGGVFVADEVQGGLDRMASNAKAERVFLKLLRLHTDQGRKVNHVGSTTYAPALFAKHPDAEGCTKRSFKNAMETLLSSGKISVQTYGPPSKLRQFLVAN